MFESAPLVLSILLMGLVPGNGANSRFPVARLPLAPPALTSEQIFPGQKLARSLSASGAVILDLQSGQELFALNANERRAVGSLTKLMTAVLVVESHAMDEVVTIPADVRMINGSNAGLPPKEHFTVGDLLSALLIASANDAADVLARFHSGSTEEFVQAMNDRARMLGLSNTSFANPSGLDHRDQWSTPRDIARLASFALRNEQIRKRLSTSVATIKSREGKTINLAHTHALLRKGSSVLAGKTGTTNAARQCLFSLVREGDRELVVILLGSDERYTDLRAVLRILSSFFA